MEPPNVIFYGVLIQVVVYDNCIGATPISSGGRTVTSSQLDLSIKT